jgi:hypothetical protein
MSRITDQRHHITANVWNTAEGGLKFPAAMAAANFNETERRD